MYCPTCGADLPEGSSFCTTCGTALAQPNYVETPEPAVKPKSRFSVLRLISLLLTLVCIGLLIGSYFTIINTSFEDIAFISFAAEIAGDDMDELDNMEDELEQAHREMEREIDPYMDELGKKDKKKVEALLDTFGEFADCRSLNNANKVMNAVKEAADMDVIEDNNIDVSMEELEEASGILNTVFIVVLAMMLFCLAFCAFGGFFRINGLVITGLVFSVIYGLIFTGFVFPILFLMFNIALCIFNSKSKNQERSAAY